MIKNRIAIAAGSFLLGTVAPAILASEPVHKACVASVRSDRSVASAWLTPSFPGTSCLRPWLPWQRATSPRWRRP